MLSLKFGRPARWRSVRAFWGGELQPPPFQIDQPGSTQRGLQFLHIGDTQPVLQHPALRIKIRIHAITHLP